LSGCPSNSEASVNIRSRLQPSLPKWFASATPANRTAAEDPHPIPIGISLRMSSASGTSAAPFADKVFW